MTLAAPATPRGHAHRLSRRCPHHLTKQAAVKTGVGDGAFLPFRASLFMTTLMDNSMLAQNTCKLKTNFFIEKTLTFPFLKTKARKSKQNTIAKPLLPI